MIFDHIDKEIHQFLVENLLMMALLSSRNDHYPGIQLYNTKIFFENTGWGNSKIFGAEMGVLRFVWEFYVSVK